MNKQGKANNPTPGRRIALETLVRVELDQAYANRVLHALFLREQPRAEVRAEATELVYGTLRRLTRYDYLLAQLLRQPLRKLPPQIRNILRMALFEIESGNCPAYAAVDQGVKLAKASGQAGLAKLVNGVLRTYARQGQKLSLPDFAREPKKHLIIAHSHPEWLIESWLERWSVDLVHRLVRSNNLPAPLSLRVNTLRTTRSDLISELMGLGFVVEESPLLPEAVRILRGSSLEQLPPLLEGRCLVQDEGAMLITKLLDPRPGDEVIDLCAAPGGKTTHMAQLMENRGCIWAVDQYEHKTRLIAETATRLGMNIIRIQTGDARMWTAPQPVDRLLLDAPCTGSGVIRRRPDLRCRRRPEDLAELFKLQQQLLAAAAKMVKPGGVLVYSTCSLQAEENERQVQAFLEEHPEFRPCQPPEEFKALLPGYPLYEYAEGGGITLFPSEYNDGFFMARLQRKA
ncbi:MAG TPA: 16S rRNA (cytosine(967)-C(5))-methyltransferase RsmB [Bacillota bacterium]|nr:16S rRNA (cytosine(967)-C(5))-methyltransferase RsmB [Bacillota bacterium]